MSSHDFTIVVYGAIFLAGIGLQLFALRPVSKVPTLGSLLTWVMRTRSGRVGVAAGWAWLGLHYFAR